MYFLQVKNSFILGNSWYHECGFCLEILMNLDKVILTGRLFFGAHLHDGNWYIVEFLFSVVNSTKI